MKPLLASTALLLGGAGVAFADAHVATVQSEANATIAADLAGATVYRTDGAFDLDGDIQEVGEVEEVFLGEDGSIRAIAASVGGFLGLGERVIALDLSEARVVAARDGEPVIIVSTPAAVLEEAEEFDLAAPALDGPAGAVDRDGFEASVLPETTPLVDGDADDNRVAGTIAVDNEGTGMTTQSGVDLVENRSGAPTTPMNDLTSEAPTTNVPNLDEGTVVDNPQTPATAVIDGGQVETDTGVASGAPEEMAENDDTIDLDLAEPDATVTVGNVAPGLEANAELRESPAVVTDEDLAGGADGTDATLPGEGPIVERAGYTPLLHDEIVLPQLEGVEVYGVDDALIGEIGYTVNAASSAMGHPLAILNIGGFLGIGDHEVAVPIREITFLDGADGLRGYIAAEEDALREMPEYEG